MSMGFEDARHLLSRTGFAPSPVELARFLAMSRDEGVRVLLDGLQTEPRTTPPSWVEDPPPSRLMRRTMRKAFREQQRERIRELQVWWYLEMSWTPSPLTERLTLFWHNHFVTAFKKVKFPGALYRQNAVFRRLGASSFRELLHEASRDPAMIAYLDNQSNRKGAANENFARELLELFTLGEGQGYTEEDIQEAARAFTGWKVKRATGQQVFSWRHFDAGEKHFMGRRGHFRGEDILDIVLEQERCAEHIVERLWSAFVVTPPDLGTVRSLAATLREGDYALRPVIEGLFSSPSFWAEENRGTQIKSPAALIVGLLRSLELQISDLRKLPKAGRQLGQMLFNPPNVKGWPGGLAWITSSTLMARRTLLEKAVSRRGVKKRLKSLEAWLEPLDGVLTGDVVERARAVLLVETPVFERDPSMTDAEAVASLLLDPAYQLM